MAPQFIKVGYDRLLAVTPAAVARLPQTRNRVSRQFRHSNYGQFGRRRSGDERQDPAAAIGRAISAQRTLGLSCQTFRRADQLVTGASVSLTARGAFSVAGGAPHRCSPRCRDGSLRSKPPFEKLHAAIASSVARSAEGRRSECARACSKRGQVRPRGESAGAGAITKAGDDRTRGGDHAHCNLASIELPDANAYGGRQQVGFVETGSFAKPEARGPNCTMGQHPRSRRDDRT